MSNQFFATASQVRNFEQLDEFAQKHGYEVEQTDAGIVVTCQEDGYKSIPFASAADAAEFIAGDLDAECFDAVRRHSMAELKDTWCQLAPAATTAKAIAKAAKVDPKIQQIVDATTNVLISFDLRKMSTWVELLYQAQVIA